MSVRLLDGPAAGVSLGLRRVPVFLRVVIHRETGKVDALDQLYDEPLKAEAIHVYQGVPGTLMALRGDIIVCVRGADGMQAAATGSGDYRHRPDVDGETVRETDAWRAWCLAQPRLRASRTMPTFASIKGDAVALAAELRAADERAGR